MIYPNFKPLAEQNTALAKACSQLFMDPRGFENYAYSHDPAVTEAYGSGAAFILHAETELVAAHASFLQHTSEEGTQSRRAFAPMTNDMPHTDDLVARYDELVGEAQLLTRNAGYGQVLNNIDTFGNLGWDGVRSWMHGKVLNSGRTLQAVYIVGRNRANGKLADVLAYPNRIAQELGLLARESFVSMILNTDETAPTDAKAESEFKRNILHNDRFYKSLGYAAAGSLLMSVDEYRQALHDLQSR